MAKGKKHHVVISESVAQSDMPGKAAIACWKSRIALHNNIRADAASQIGPPLFSFLIFFALSSVHDTVVDVVNPKLMKS